MKRDLSLKNFSKIIKNPLFIILVAFVIRLIYLILSSTINSPPVMDGWDYDTFAMHILKYHEFSIFLGKPSALRPPLYPFSLSIVYLIFGHSYPAVRIVQALLSALSCYILYLTAKEILNEQSAFISAWIFSFYPGAIYLCGRLLSETLFILLFLSVFYFLFKKKNVYLAGIFLGLSILTRPNVLAFLPFLYIWFLFMLSKKELLIQGSIVIVEILIITSPWIIRNYKIYHRFVLISTQGGWTFFACNNSSADGGYTSGSLKKIPGFKEKFIYAPSNLPIWRGLNEVESDKKFYRLGFTWIKENPKKFLHLLLLKFIKTWNPLRKPSQAFVERYTLLFGIFYGIIIFFAIWGFAVTLGEWRKLFIIYSPILAVTLTCLIFYGSTRMRFLADPFLIMLSAASGSRGKPKTSAKKKI